MSATSRVHIRTPDKSRNEHHRSEATEVKASATPEQSPGDVPVPPPQLEQESDCAPPRGDTHFSAVASAQDAALPVSVGKKRVTSQAGADVQSALANCAPCEISSAPESMPAAPNAAADDPGASEEFAAESNQPPTAKTELQGAIDECEALAGTSGKMVSEKRDTQAAPILEKSLRFMAAYKAAADAERERVREYLKTKLNLGRKPNVGNLALVAVYLCVSSADWVQTEPQRKHWSRFATVVNLAASKQVSPDEASKWLENKTLSGLLAEWRGMPAVAATKSKRKRPVPVPTEYGSLT